MFGHRLLRVTSVGLVIAVALVTPVLATASSMSASADTVVDGCTIVSNPTPTDFTDCPNASFAGATLGGVNFSYANLAGAVFVSCTNGPPASAAQCNSADLTNANLTRGSFRCHALRQHHGRSGQHLRTRLWICQPEWSRPRRSRPFHGRGLRQLHWSRSCWSDFDQR